MTPQKTGKNHMNQNKPSQTSRLFTVALIALALSACAANTPQRLCHGPLTPINASTPPGATR